VQVQLPWTGERYVPEVEGDVEMEHLHRYAIARDLAYGKDVLDIACGEGYGSQLLATVARKVTGVDISAEAIAHAARKYVRPNIAFAVGSCACIPLPDASVDLVVSFETIEHHDQHLDMMREIRRVLHANGVLIISSPDKHEYSDEPGYKNEYHVKELYLSEFRDLLATGFKHVRLFGQRVYFGSLVAPTDGRATRFVSYSRRDESVRREPGIMKPVYYIAVASNAALPQIHGGLYDGTSYLGSQIAGRDVQIANFTRAAAERDGRIASLHQAVAERDGQIADLHQAAAERDGQIAGLHQGVAERDGQIADLHQAAAERDGQIAGLHQGVAECDRQIGALRRQLAQHQTEEASLAQQISRLRRRLELVHSSSSWRVTRPLRASQRLLSRLFAGIRRTEDPSTVGLPAVVGPLVRNVSDDVATAKPPVEKRQRAVDDFDRNFYLQAYPDVAASGVDPYQHYLNQGRKEGRLSRALQLIANVEPQVLASDRPTVLVVSHEASRTGAPILAWNICRELRNRCNVIALLLGGGGIASYFPEVCNVVVGPYDRPIRNPMAVGPIVNDICDRYRIDVALINSIESRAGIQPLAERFVPSVLLIHEFFTYTRPREEFVAAMRHAAAVVFSARIVQRNAMNERTRPVVDASHVLAQGKCVIPAGVQTGVAPAIELAAIEAFVRRGDRKFLVLGAGTVQYRKGVDLFVATAAEVRRLGRDADVAMLWIGHGFDPERDLSYSAYVQQQIVGAGLDNVAVVGEVENLEAVYALADVLFLSSRLDPMPNVAIDMMSLGKPVICFDTATGIAEVLAHHPRTAKCIVPFAHVGEAAALILRMQSSPMFVEAVSVGVRDLVAKYFDMPTYVARLFEIAMAAQARSLQERADAKTLLEARGFDINFAAGPLAPTETREQAIVSFLRSSVTRIDARRPAPGFDATIYARHHDIDGWNPFAHWLRAGRPDGPWRVEVIDPSRRTETSVATTLRRALHVHAFYIDLLDDIVARLGCEGPACDLFVSVASDTDTAQARSLLEGYRRGACDVQVVPNRGRDIGPFLTTFGSKLAAYDVVGHVHTKHSLALGNREFVRRWREYLLANLVSGEHNSADAILAHFAEDPQLGIVYPDDPHLLDWGWNRDFAAALARRMGIESLPDVPPSFPVGTMFWARPAALAPLFDLGLDWGDYPPEPLPYDGSILHAIERLLPIVVAHTGYRRAVVHAPGSTR